VMQQGGEARAAPPFDAVRLQSAAQRNGRRRDGDVQIAA
jgi:hypothetical protein